MRGLQSPSAVPETRIARAPLAARQGPSIRFVWCVKRQYATTYDTLGRIDCILEPGRQDTRPNAAQQDQRPAVAVPHRHLQRLLSGAWRRRDAVSYVFYIICITYYVICVTLCQPPPSAPARHRRPLRALPAPRCNREGTACRPPHPAPYLACATTTCIGVLQRQGRGANGPRAHPHVGPARLPGPPGQEVRRAAQQQTPPRPQA
jgi:hypothetical protein